MVLVLGQDPSSFSHRNPLHLFLIKIVRNPIKTIWDHISQSSNHSSFTHPITVWSLQAEARTRVVTEPLVRILWKILSLKSLSFNLCITPKFLTSFHLFFKGGRDSQCGTFCGRPVQSNLWWTCSQWRQRQGKMFHIFGFHKIIHQSLTLVYPVTTKIK